MNKVFISGNLTRDAEVRTTANGYTFANFTVAVNDRVKDPDTGEWGDKAYYIACTWGGKRAAAISGKLIKGARVYIEGKLKQSEWTDRNGNRRTAIDVIVDDLNVHLKASDVPAEGQEEQPATTEPYGEEIPF